MNNRRNILISLILPLVVVLMGGCCQEEPDFPANGFLRLGIGCDVQKNVSRATPSQLGKPLADKFSLRVQRSGSEYADYNGPFVEDLEVKVGTYNITAYYGENVPLGKDAPYYEGVATAVIEEGGSTFVTIPCRVANALVSVAFGRDEEERARFDKFYENYGLLVQIGRHSLAITHEDKNASIYFPAGSNPTLIFYGTLRENSKVVSCEVSSSDLPEAFDAADHGIITLTLPDPESALDINIGKVEMETITIEETIPLSWLPVPVATARHLYDTAGCLVGTDVNLSSSYPGMQWRTVITNASGEEVRYIEGIGDLQLSYDKFPEYPYLPSGDYKAIYYVMQGEEAKEVNRSEFSVDKPQLELIVDGYTSYTKYLEGDIVAANACDGNSVHDLLVALNVSEALLAKYAYTFTFQYASGDVENVEVGKNRFFRESKGGQVPSFDPYRLKANATFDGVSLSAEKEFYITGLPVKYAPPTTSNGWSKTSGTVNFNSGDTKLDKGAITNSSLAIPAQTKTEMDYNVMIRAAATLLSSTKFTITIGSTEVFSETLRGSLISENTSNYSGSKAYTSTSQTTTIKCNSSKSYATIYSLSLKYGE